MANFYPVIHVEHSAQVHRNAAIAYESGADGVFLVSHGPESAKYRAERIDAMYASLRDQYPKWPIGINYLGFGISEALDWCAKKNVDMLWSNSATSSSITRSDGTPRVDVLAKHKNMYDEFFTKKYNNFKHQFTVLFGGFAFKGQEQLVNLQLGAKLVSQLVHIVCTSGDAAGVPSSIEQLKTISDALYKPSQLAIVSGVDINNVEAMLPYAGHFLVSTGISSSFAEFDPDKVKALSDKIHGYSSDK